MSLGPLRVFRYRFAHFANLVGMPARVPVDQLDHLSAIDLPEVGVSAANRVKISAFASPFHSAIARRLKSAHGSSECPKAPARPQNLGGLYLRQSAPERGKDPHFSPRIAPRLHFAPIGDPTPASFLDGHHVLDAFHNGPAPRTGLDQALFGRNTIHRLPKILPPVFQHRDKVHEE